MVVEKQEGKWICLVLGYQHIGKLSFDDIKSEIEQLFGRNLLHLCIIGGNLTENKFENFIESYFFVMIKPPVDRFFEVVKRSVIFDHIFRDEDNQVSVFTDKEIQRMESRGNSIVSKPLRNGTFIIVKSGLYGGLYGIVVGSDKKQATCDVLFRFYTRTVIVPIKRINLEANSSLGNIMKRVKDGPAIKKRKGSQCMSITTETKLTTSRKIKRD